MIWLVLLLLTLLLAFFVAAEFAAVSVRESRIERHAEEGNARARVLLSILRDPHRLDSYIAVSQIGITLASLVAGAYAQAALAPALLPLFRRFGGFQEAAAFSAATTTVLVGLTVVQMVLGELVPKSLALQMPTRVALWTVRPMQWSQWLLAGFVRLLNGSGGLVLRLLRMPAAGHRHVHSPEEIEYLVAESGKGGLLKPSEQIRLRHALQLGRRAGSALMVPRTRIVALEADAPMAEAIRVALDSPFTRLPVYDGSIDQVVGIVHVRHVALAVRTEGASIRSIMQPALVLPATLTADRILVRFKEERHTMAILLDEFGGTAGLITVDNILDNLIGDIADEFRAPDDGAQRLPDGRVRLPGDMPIDEAARWTRATWPESSATVGGVVAAAMSEMPAAGDVVVLPGMQVEVERVDRRAIISVVVAVNASFSAREATDE
ncbi:MAG TPA: hemolysin family protein [Gemmatimonadaceae bacterium]|nr:hemolysin family protein [Gemmatimonadaceae bacterium]